MYKRILLAYDGSLEGRMALREGALTAREHGAEVFLLAIIPPALLVDSMGMPSLAPSSDWQTILKEGLARVSELGLIAKGAVVQADPIDAIVSYADEIDADLAVVGYVKRSLWSRLVSEPTPSALMHRLSCSLLVSKRVIPDEVIEQKRKKMSLA